MLCVTRIGDGAQNFERLAVQNISERISRDIEKLLIRREGEAPVLFSGHVEGYKLLRDKYPVSIKHLNALASPVGDIHESIFRDRQIVHYEILFENWKAIALNKRAGWTKRLRRGVSGALIRIQGLAAIGAPHALELASIRIKHDDSAIFIAICDEEFICFGVVSERVRTPDDFSGIATKLATPANRHYKFALFTELENLSVPW